MARVIAGSYVERSSFVVCTYRSYVGTITIGKTVYLQYACLGCGKLIQVAL